jgi:hypothetical protein
MKTGSMNNFPHTTSMMIFVIDKDDRILLKTDNEHLVTFKIDTVGEVNIRKMVCDELYMHDILIYPENLQHKGILKNEDKMVFIYTTGEFATNNTLPSLNYLWYTKEEIPFYRMSGFEKHVLTMILDGEKIGF